MWSSLPFSKKTTGLITLFVMGGGVGVVCIAVVHQVFFFFGKLLPNSLSFCEVFLNVIASFDVTTLSQYCRTSSTDSGSKMG